MIWSLAFSMVIPGSAQLLQTLHCFSSKIVGHNLPILNFRTQDHIRMRIVMNDVTNRVGPSRDHWGMSIFRSKQLQVESMHTTKGLMIAQWCTSIRVYAFIVVRLVSSSSPRPLSYLWRGLKLLNFQESERPPGAARFVFSDHQSCTAICHRAKLASSREVSCNFTRATFQ